MNTKTVVSFTDFSAAADNAVSRAAQLAARLGITLHLGYSGNATGSLRGDRLDRLDMRAMQMARRWTIDVQPMPHETRGLEQWLYSRGLSSLVVVDVATGASLRPRSGWGLGPVLLDRCASPLMLVQRDASTPCKSVLIPFRQHDEAVRLGRFAAQMTNPKTWELFELNAGRSAASGPTTHGGLLHHREWPPPAMQAGDSPQIRYTDQLSSRRNRMLFHTRSGDTALSVKHQAQCASADMVVAICPPDRLLERWRRRTFGQRLVQALCSDLLLCPPELAHASAADAHRRLLASIAPVDNPLSMFPWGRV